MDRRNFFKTSAGSAAIAAGVSGCKVEKIQKDGNTGKGRGITELGGHSLADLREQYRYDLFDDYLPFIYKYVYDHEFGGFMCNTNYQGENISTNKGAWYEGRGMWVHSFLYNKIDPDSKHIEVVKKSADFILKHKPSDDQFWDKSYSKEGVAQGSPGDIYCDLFIANGLAEFSKSPGNEQYWDISKELLVKCMRRYDRGDYDYEVYYGPADAKHKLPARVLGHWMVILRLATQMLELRDDPDIEAIAGRTVDAIMNHHFNPAYGLMNEVISHDLSRTDDEFNQFSYTGHAIETLWMVLYEAARKKDRGLFDDAAVMFKRHVEISWDDVYGGAFRCLDHVDNNTWKTDKVLWLQEEVLIGTLFMIEHTGDEWAKEWFVKMYDYVQDKFPLKRHGLPLWILGADRKVTFNPARGRIGNFHHPRHLMLNLISLDTIIENEGRVSGLFG